MAATTLSALGARKAETVGRLDRALARSDAYRVLAVTFDDPDAPHRTDDPAISLLRAAAGRLGLAVAPGQWHAVRRIASRRARSAEHRAIFGHVVAHGCPAYETEYGRGHLFAQAQALGDIGGFYAAFGVHPRPGAERPDHIASELEFVALVALKEALALARGESDRVGICRDALAAFLADHLGRWLPAFAARLTRHAPDSGYAAAAAIAALLAADHAAELGAIPELLGPDEVMPVGAPADGFRFDCE